MEVHDRHYDNHVLLDPEKDTEGKWPREAALHIICDSRVELRVELDPVERALHGGEKALPEVSLPCFVPGCSADHLLAGLRMKADGFHSRAAYALANTSAASRSSTTPSSTSRHRA